MTTADSGLAAVQVRLLGGFSVSVGGRPIPDSAWRLQKARAVVKLLSLAPGHRMHRERLMELLWPDHDVDAAANNLYVSLHIARQALTGGPSALFVAGALRLSQHIVSLQPPGDLWVDVEAFERAAAAAHGTDDPAAYQHALALYSGDLLPDDHYDEWASSRREALRETYVALLLAVARLYESRGEYSSAVEALQQAIAMQPFREEAHAGLMRLYALMGRRSDALRQFARLEAALRRELDTTPDEDTRRLFRDIAEGRFPAAMPDPANPNLPTPRRSLLPAAQPPPLRPATTSDAPQQHTPRIPFVGRRRERARLMNAWRAARRSPHLALISGEPGIGKTRLAEELLLRAGRQGVVTVSARCYASAGELAYAPVGAWLRSDALWPALFSLEDLWLAEAARVLPEILVEHDALARPEPMTESWQRQRFFDALRRALLATGRPLLLLLDDIQWCDRETLEWLHYVLHALHAAPGPDAPLLVAATLRPGEAGEEAGLPSMLADLRHSGKVTEFELDPLDHDETTDLAAKALGRQLGETAADRLFAESEGNPLFVVQLARAGYVDRWGGQQSSQGDALPTPTASTLPPTLRTAIAARLAQLSPPARELAGLASAIGRDFSFDLLLQASARDEETLLRGVDELLQRRLVRERPTGDYDFAHDKIREVAYGGLNAARRRTLHRRIARALEVLHAGTLDDVSGQVAAHYVAAGQAERAIPYLERAGDRARALGAFVAAAGFYRELVARLDALDRTVDAVGAREKLAEVLFVLMRYDEALDVLERAVAIYRTMGDLDGLARSTALIGYGLWGRGTPDQGLTRLRSAMPAFAVAAPSPGLARIYRAWADLTFRNRAPAEALVTLERAIQIARQSEDESLLHRFRFTHGIFLATAGRWDEGLALAAAEVAHFETMDDPRLLEDVLVNFEELMLRGGSVGDARRLGERAIALAGRIGSPHSMAFAHGNYGDTLYHAGEWRMARTAFSTAASLIEGHGANRSTPYLSCGLELLALAQGDAEPAAQRLEQIVALAEQMGEFEALYWALGGLTEYYLLTGRAHAARARLEPLLSRPDELDIYAAQCLPFLVWAYLDLDDVERAQALLERLRTDLTGVGGGLTQANTLRVRALAALRANDSDAAVAALDDALARTREMPYPYAEAKALYVYGLLHTVRGEPALARERLRAALAILNRLGERLYAGHVERALSALS